MVEKLQIRNFRCFADLQLGGLRRINVVVGRNGSGKTAVLESIFLAAGGEPKMALRLRTWRGLGATLKLGPERRMFEAIWKDLFFGLDQNRFRPQLASRIRRKALRGSLNEQAKQGTQNHRGTQG